MCGAIETARGGGGEEEEEEGERAKLREIFRCGVHAFAGVDPDPVKLDSNKEIDSIFDGFLAISVCFQAGRLTMPIKQRRIDRAVAAAAI